MNYTPLGVNTQTFIRLASGDGATVNIDNGWFRRNAEVVASAEGSIHEACSHHHSQLSHNVETEFGIDENELFNLVDRICQFYLKCSQSRNTVLYYPQSSKN